MASYVALTPETPLRVEKLVSVHYFEYSSSYYFEGESHDFWEFLYVDKGELDVRAGDAVHHLKKGEIIFHRPEEFHSLAANGKVAPNLVVASFVCNGEAMRYFEGRTMAISDADRAVLAQIVMEADCAFSSPLNDPQTMQLERRTGGDTLFGAEQMTALCIETLLIRLVRRGREPQPAPEQTSYIRERTQQEFIDRVHAYFEANISRKLTLADICRDNLVGRSYLQKIFREKTGGGAMEYFGQMKIAAAQEMIPGGSHNFTEIAALLGYNSIHYFFRHIKKVTGMTPSEYASSVKVLSGKTRSGL